MKTLKLRWRMWKHYTSPWNKTLHAALLAINALNIIVSSTSPSLTFWANTLIFGLLTLAVIMWDTWKAAYTRTDGLRTLGASVTGALQEHKFIHITNAGGNYYIKPEHIGEHPDDMDGEIFTDEIVIRRGLDSDGERITAYRIPDDLSEVDVMGLLEITKQQYFYDKMELENE